MGLQLGNPDWQRRYTTSMAPLLNLTYNDAIDSLSAITDSNGFEYINVTTDSGVSNAFMHVKLDWFQDQNATQPMGFTDYVIPPLDFIVQKIPIMTRYFKLEMGPVGGVTGHTVHAIVYGTNADQENIVTQQTATPMLQRNQTIPAGGTQTDQIAGMLGGPVKISINDEFNKNWIAFTQYWDFNVQNWLLFWAARGVDRGQSWSEYVNLPYAPCRLSVNNTDAAISTFDYSVVGP